MPSEQTHPRPAVLSRFMRSQVVRWALAAVIIPLLVLGAFGGTTFLAHAHDGHDMHLHASPSIEAARFSAHQHRISHALGTAPCEDPRAGHEGHSKSGELASKPLQAPDFPAPIEDQSGLVITIPDHEQLVSRGIDLPQTLQATQILHCALAWFWTQPDVSHEEGSPGGRVVGGPLHLSAFTAAQRLVRTSNALLI